MKKKNQSFEESMGELELVVSKLESGELELEKSLELFESGVKLYKSCKKKLEEVEKKITLLTESLDEEAID